MSKKNKKSLKTKLQGIQLSGLQSYHAYLVDQLENHTDKPIKKAYKKYIKSEIKRNEKKTKKLAKKLGKKVS